ncbi:MAG: MarR family winged helix-turn-helix transcriptional regulator, partial [Natronosporangium sp.]
MDADHVDRMVAAWARLDPALDIEPLEVAGRLLRCAAYLERAIDQALRPLGLSFGDFDVINTLRRRAEPAGTNPTALAASALITSGAMTSRLDRLERAGLVERHPDPYDRRAILVRLTPAGRDRASRALAAVLAADRQFLDPLGQDDRVSVAAALKRLL